MTRYGELNPEAFEAFLAWLSPDREEAARKFKQLQKLLILLFERRGCHIPDELFYETVKRAGNNIRSGTVRRSDNPVAYCYGVAKNVLREYWRDMPLEPMPADPPSPKIEPEWDERELACLDECLERLSEHHRILVTRFHKYDGREKIEERKKMAAEEGGSNALRIKVFRIRNTLRECVSECISQNGGAPAQ